MAAPMRPIPFRIDIDDPLERVRAVWDAQWKDETFHRVLREYITPHSSTVHRGSTSSASTTTPTSTSPSPSTGALSTTIFILTVGSPLTNTASTLHGGASSTIFDMLTSMALAPHSAPGFWRFAGVSKTLNCSYLKPVPLGMVVCVGCEVLSLGKRSAVLKGWMREWDQEADGGRGAPTGEVLVVCEHSKANVDAVMERI